MERFLHHLDAVHPGVDDGCCVSARTGEGVEALRGVAGGAVPVRRRRRDAPAAARRAAAGGERFFDAEAEQLARLCHAMAERFAARRAADRARARRRRRARTRATSRSSSSTR